MFPMDRKPVVVAVEYESRGKRVTKQFRSYHESKRFYVQKSNEGKNPKVVKPS